jgi:DNA-binding response OmpR family regulator
LVAAALLESSGGDVRLAHSAEELLLLIQTSPARLVVMDLLLPHLSALVLVRQLKANAATRDAVVVALSSFDSTVVDTMAMSAGCAACIRKPIDPRTFVPTVAALLGGRS